MTTILNSYLTLNLLLIVFAGFCLLARKLTPTQRLRFQYLGLSLVILIPFIQPLLPSPEFTVPLVKVWEGSSHGQTFDAPVTKNSFMTVANVTQNWRVETSSFFSGLCLLLILVAAFSSWSIWKDLKILKRLSSGAFLFKRLGSVQVFTHPEIKVPFSFWLPGKYNTYLPESMLSNPSLLKVSLMHELQHHRQGDTRWLFALMAIRSLCCFNPIAYWLEREISETQEYACDESLTLQKDISNDEYIRCLIEVAQTSVNSSVEPVCATGFCFGRGQKILKRRIHNMFTYQKLTGQSRLVFMLLVLSSMLATVGWAARNMVQDRKITMDEAQTLVKNQDEFPLVVNSAVLSQLNRYLGTPEGREFFIQTLQRKKAFDSILSAKTREYGTPAELNAIPVVESGYVNRTNPNGVRAAGLWMFIPATARRYGMKVNGTVDERLNVTKETDAAQRYLLANKHMFKDWHLSILAYNMGERAVLNGIKKFKTRNAFELVDFGVEGDKNYLPSVMAAMIIMRNPQLLD